MSPGDKKEVVGRKICMSECLAITTASLSEGMQFDCGGKRRFIFNLYKLVMFRQIYTEYGDTGKQWFPLL